LDSEILAEVYLELIGGRQPDFGLSTQASKANATGTTTAWHAGPRETPLPPRLTEDEAAAHAAFVAKLGDGALWKKLA
ncbi:MAG: DNA polymerase III subunit epsilon, partial [Alphaproteobacteria bacterium]|nr:DNA polymerase III subunit epsilon [Alphaproteobacteria bacterium]